MGGKKSAFTENSSLSSIETLEEEEEGSSLELGGDLPLGQRPPSSRFVCLFKHLVVVFFGNFGHSGTCEGFNKKF